MKKEYLIYKLSDASKDACKIDNELFPMYNVKRGLRNEDGSGVLVGLTKIGNVVGYERLPDRPDRRIRVHAGSRILFSANDIFFEQFGIPADMVCFSAFRGLWSRIAPGCRKRVLEALRRSSWKPGRCERFEIELLDPEKGSRWFDFECEFSRDAMPSGRLLRRRHHRAQAA